MTPREDREYLRALKMEAGMTERINISSGTRWEAFAGYSRAVRLGNMIEVAGTTAVDEQGRVFGAGSPYQQACYIFAKIERALQEAGGSLGDVVRTRMFVTDISRWEEVAQAHGEFFEKIRPASTLVAVMALVEPELLVEIEATAILLVGGN
jgi:enamine deaminase RidA (YjgF/YER057c/UK114 family)